MMKKGNTYTADPTAPVEKKPETGKKRLRSGFTTGTAATAAVKGALLTLLGSSPPGTVSVTLPSGDTLPVRIHRCEHLGDRSARCSVIKDAGDDPDVTHRAEIGATVTLEAIPAPSSESPPIRILGGEGVGVVTKPGLEVAPGNPAINSGPRQMIDEAVREVLGNRNTGLSVTVTIFVPEGKRLAEKTLNPRLGILGGISILGTTGIVRPLSHAAYTATIDAAVSVARASGAEGLVFTTGRRSERFAQDLWPQLPQEAFIQMGDHVRHAMEAAARNATAKVTLALFFGKAVKIAQGIGYTHAGATRLALERLAERTISLTGDRALGAAVTGANTAREVFGMLRERHFEVVAAVGRNAGKAVSRFAGESVSIRVVILDFDGRPVFDSDGKLRSSGTKTKRDGTP